MPAYLVASFVVFMVCHGELVRLRPPPAALTGYYLWIAFGGALGGLAVGIAAPRLLDSDHDLAIAVFVAGAVVFAAQLSGEQQLRRRLVGGALGLLALGSLLLWARHTETEHALLSARNFYGTLRIEEEGDTGDPDERRQLFHGRIMHGEQFLAANRTRETTSYYSPTSGVALAIKATRRFIQPQRVGVIGLGAGVLAAYGRAQDSYRFYEINPLVVALARSEFSFLKESAAKIELALGDARLVLELEAPQGFDVLAVDAFTGDAIPIHLLTEEAIALYLRHLGPGGLLAVHVSNKYLDLAPLVRLAAERLGWVARIVDDDEDSDDEEEDDAKSASSWVIVAKESNRLSERELGGDATEIAVPPGLAPWRDDYSSLFSVLKRRGDRE